MFYVLIALGLALNALGIYVLSERSRSGRVPTKLNQDGVRTLEERVSAIEEHLFKRSMESVAMAEDTVEGNVVIADSLKKRLDMLVALQGKNYNLEKLSKSLRMKRGEVLLLKGLLRSYRK